MFKSDNNNGILMAQHSPSEIQAKMSRVTTADEGLYWQGFSDGG